MYFDMGGAQLHCAPFIVLGLFVAIGVNVRLSLTPQAT